MPTSEIVCDETTALGALIDFVLTYDESIYDPRRVRSILG